MVPAPRRLRPWLALDIVGSVGGPSWVQDFGGRLESGDPAGTCHNAVVALDSFTVARAGQIGASDCEAIGEGWLAQPVNTLSSGAYMVFGAWIVVSALRRRGHETMTQVAFGIALAGVGVGSILFHGPMPPGARLVHDLTIASVFALIAARAVGTMQGWSEGFVMGLFAGITALIGVAMAVSPNVGIALSAVVGLAALGLETYLYRAGRRERISSQLVSWLAAVMVLLLAGGLVNLLGRTGGPLCDPASALQGHAAWHVLTAAAFGLYGYRAFLVPVAAVR